MSISTTNITTTILSQTIGVGSKDVGTLCSSTAVNKWSKYKPISYPSNNGMTLELQQQQIYGLLIPSTSDAGDETLGNTWIYNKPVGGVNSPYRLGDFRGYNHSSVQPYSVYIPDTLGTDGTGGNVSVSVHNVPSDNIAFSDLFPNTYYFGVSIPGFCKTALTNMVNNGQVVSIADCPGRLTAGTVEVILFMTDSVISTWNSDFIGTMYGLNCDANVAVKNVPVKQAKANTYNLIINGLNTVDMPKITRVGAVITGTTIMQLAKFTTMLTYNYSLLNITLTIRQNSTNAVAYTATFATDSHSQPVGLGSDYQELNGNFSIISSVYYSMGSLPVLSIGDCYNATYTLNYTQE